MEGTTDQIEAALKEFEGDYDTEELRLWIGVLEGRATSSKL
jgi:hypothetical protein